MAVRVPVFYHPDASILSWDQYRVTQKAHDKPDDMRQQAFPSKMAVRNVYATTGWTVAQGKMEAASNASAGALINALNAVGILGDQTTELPKKLQEDSSFDWLLDTWIVPKTTSRGTGVIYHMGLQLYARNSRTDLLLEFPVNLDDLSKWEP